MDLNETLRIIDRRKSVRSFSERRIEPDKKDAILSAVYRAPTAGAMMLYTILDITDQDIKDKLAVSCDDQPFISKSPLVLIFLADYQRMWDYFIASGTAELCRNEGCESRTPGEGDFLLACCDALIAAQTGVIAAESMNITSCYIGDIMENYEYHKELLDLPDYVFPIGMICFGYPMATYPGIGRIPRYDSEYVLHENRYKRFSEDKLLKMTEPIENMSGGKVKYLGNAQNYGQHTFLRKFDTDFSREMTRSVAAAMEKWRSKRS